MTYFKNIVFLVLGMLILSGCFGNTQKSIKDETAKLSIKSIAILPIETATDADVKDAQFLRTRIFEEIFLRATPRYPRKTWINAWARRPAMPTTRHLPCRRRL